MKDNEKVIEEARLESEAQAPAGGEKAPASPETPPERATEFVPKSVHAELDDKYKRLYAEFENYKKRIARDREELVKYGNESLVYEMLPSMDNLEIALKHAGGENSGLAGGVANTLRELSRTLEKFGLKPIEAVGKPFNPEFHHAMSQAERDDVDENTVVEEFRKGYMFRDKVLRASLVSVSKRRSEKETAVEN